MALTHLNLNTFVTMSTDREKSAEGNNMSQRSSTYKEKTRKDGGMKQQPD